ncbi:hypothetical protein L7F22_033476 [Adiantum nelumboides]|nr:hypothetical protein [Adiantum nelumboides]
MVPIGHVKAQDNFKLQLADHCSKRFRRGTLPHFSLESKLKLKGERPKGMDKDEWEELDEEKQSAASQIYWVKKLVDLKMKEGIAMSKHLNEFHTIFSQLTAQKIVFPDSMKAMFLLITLSDNWDTFCMVLSNFFTPEGLNVEGRFLTKEVNSKNIEKGKGSSALSVRKGHMRRKWKQVKGKAKSFEQDDKKNNSVKIEEVNVTGSNSDSDFEIAAGDIFLTSSYDFAFLIAKDGYAMSD